MFKLERYALHSHKFPDLSSSGTPSNLIQLAYFLPEDLIEILRFEFKHPVMHCNVSQPLFGQE